MQILYHKPTTGMRRASPLLRLPPEILDTICTYVFEPYDLLLESWIFGHFDRVCQKRRALMFLLDDGRVYQNYRRLAVSSTRDQHHDSDNILFVCKTLLPIARRARQQLFSGTLHVNGRNRHNGDHDLDDKFREYCDRVPSSLVDVNFRARVRFISYEFYEYGKLRLKSIADAFPNLSVFELQCISFTIHHEVMTQLKDLIQIGHLLTTSRFVYSEPVSSNQAVQNFATDVAELEAVGTIGISCCLYIQAHLGPGTFARTVVSYSQARCHSGMLNVV